MIESFHKFNTHDKLQTVVLGSYYPPEYFDFIPDPAIRDPLQKIAQEINSDLDYFEQILKSYGCKVLRPDLISKNQFVQHSLSNDVLIPPPLEPRNYYSVVENTLYQINKPSSYIKNCIESYCNDFLDLSDSNEKFFLESIEKNKNCYNSSQNLWFKKKKYLELAGIDWPTFDDYVQGKRSNLPQIAKEMQEFETALVYETKEFGSLEAPNIFPTDLGLVIDCNEFCNYEMWFKTHSNFQGQVININTGAGHTDGCFSVLGKNTILGIDPLIDYERAFPGYKVIGVNDQLYGAHIKFWRAFQNMMKPVAGKWWVPGQESNLKFINFVENYLKEWTGHVYETVFDVNVLALDEKTVCVTNINSNIEHQLKKQGIECVHIPWKHRFFVDCGIHCLTLDLYRKN